MAENNAITLSKDHIYGIVVVALVALLTVSVFTSGFGIIPVKGSCNLNSTGSTTCGTNNGTGSGNTDPYANLAQMPLTVGTLPVQGQDSAPVTWVEFSDFQCPYCSRLYLQVDTQIKTNYVDTGKVKMYFRNFPLGFHDKAHMAAEAAVCAAEQGKFWQMHDKLFQNQDAWVSSGDAKTVLAGYASDIGIDAAKFSSCLSSGKYASDVDADAAEGGTFGVQGTPGVFLMLPKAKTDMAALRNVVAAYSDGITLYQDADNVIVFVGGAYPYTAFSQILNTVTY